MTKSNVFDLKKRDESSTDLLTELLRSGARQLIAEAVEAELQGFLDQYSELKDKKGRRQIVRNGYLPEREIQTGIGKVEVKVPKVRDKSCQGIKFNSSLLPPYLRKTKSVEDVLPWLYLKGISTGDFQEALQALLSVDATGLSSSTISRCKRVWEEEHNTWELTNRQALYDCLHLNMNAPLVLTDSGGLQEETTVLGVPCITMRPNTERPITCEVGSNVMVGSCKETILREALKILKGEIPEGRVPEKWDGHAAERIVQVIVGLIAAENHRGH